MKAIMVIYAQPLENEIMDSFKNLGIKQFTKFPYLLGQGGHSEPHLDTQTWPGANSGLLVLADEAKVSIIMKAMKEIKSKNIEEGLRAFIMPLEESI